MTDETPAPTTAAQDLEWLSQPTTGPATATLERPADELASTSGSSFSKRAKVAGIFATALVVGAVGVFTLQSSSASPSANQGPGGGRFGGPPGAQNGFAPPNQQQNGSGTTQNGFGGFGGAQGTVSAVSASSITVGGTTYSVSSGTEVIVNGAQGSLSDISKGDSVFVHAHGTAAERIFVGTMPQQGGPGFGPPPGQQGQQQQGQQPGQQSGQLPGAQTGSTSST